MIALHGIGGRLLVAPLCLSAAVAVFSFTAPEFPTGGNFISVAAQVWVLGLLAVGQMFAVVTRGLDISVGAVAALSSAIAAIAWNHLGAFGVLLGPVGALLCGTVNGWLIAALDMQPILVTLGMLVGARGISLLLSDGGQVLPLADAETASGLAFQSLFGLPPIDWAALAAAAAAWWLLDRTVLGRRFVMLGSNPEAVHLIGVDEVRARMRAYQLCGLFAGLAGVLITVRAGAGLPTEGSGMELQSIAAAVIGGTALLGGTASVPGVVVGSCFIQTLLTGLNLQGVSPFAAQIAVGTVLIGSGFVEYAIRHVLSFTSQQGRRI